MSRIVYRSPCAGKEHLADYLTRYAEVSGRATGRPSLRTERARLLESSHGNRDQRDSPGLWLELTIP
jgi:hypothetical protein